MPKATSMADLMAKAKSAVRSFKKGEVVQGTITKLTSQEILVDVGAKTEAVVLEKDKSILHSLLGSLKVGDKVNVSVLNPESDQGNPVVSLRRFVDEKQWQSLEKLLSDEEIMEVTITDITKGGFLIQSEEGFSGFLPNSQAILTSNPQTLIGTKIKAVIIELNRPLRKLIFSQKAAVSDAEFEKLTKGLKPGDKIDTVVNSLTPFGVFVSFKHGENNLEGFIHLSEISWDRIESAENLYKVGQSLPAQILGVDKEGKRINLSLKRLSEDPFVNASKEFPVDKKVTGKVSKISSIGVSLDLGNGVSGLIKKDKIPPSASYSVGESIEATVSEVDSQRHRLILSPILKEKPMGYR